MHISSFSQLQKIAQAPGKTVGQRATDALGFATKALGGAGKTTLQPGGVELSEEPLYEEGKKIWLPYLTPSMQGKAIAAGANKLFKGPAATADAYTSELPYKTEYGLMGGAGGAGLGLLLALAGGGKHTGRRALLYSLLGGGLGSLLGAGAGELVRRNVTGKLPGEVGEAAKSGLINMAPLLLGPVGAAVHYGGKALGKLAK